MTAFHLFRNYVRLYSNSMPDFKSNVFRCESVIPGVLILCILNIFDHIKLIIINSFLVFYAKSAIQIGAVIIICKTVIILHNQMVGLIFPFEM